MKNFFSKIIALVGFSLFSPLLLADTFVVTPIPNAPNAPDTMTSGGFAIAMYNVYANNNNANFDAVGFMPQQGVRQIFNNGEQCGYLPAPTLDSSVCGFESANGRFPLKTGESCTLVLCISADEVGGTGSKLEGGPVVCGLPDVPYYCDQPSPANQLNVKIIDPSQGPVISVAPDPSELRPSQNFTWTVTNHGPGTAYQIYPSGMSNNILDNLVNLDISDCVSVAENDTCSITTIVDSSAPVVEKEPGSFRGANTDNATIEVGIVKQSLFITSVNITEPGTQCMEFVNESDIVLSDLRITLPTMTGITFPPSSTCIDGTSLPAHGTCCLDVAANDDADGNGIVTATYIEGSNPSGFRGEATGSITVNGPILTINNDQPVELSIGTPELDIIIANNSSFDADNISIEFVNPIAGVSMDASDCGNRLAKEDQCTVKFSTVELSEAPGGITATLRITGTNFGVSSQPVVVDKLTIALDEDFQHLQYRRILIDNNMYGSSINIDDVTFQENLEGKIEYCEEGDDCDGYNDSTICGEYLSEDSHCYILLKGLDTSTLDYAVGAITIKVSERLDPLRAFTAVFQAKHSMSLYTTGAFNKAGTTTAANIAAWDGSIWSALGQGLSGGQGKALYLYKGDLYVGGSFLTAGSMAFTQYLALWNGNAWSHLGGPGYVYLDAPVNTFTTDSDNNLLIGGSFENILEVMTAKGALKTLAPEVAPSIAVWNLNVGRLKPLQDNALVTYGINGEVSTLLFTTDDFGFDKDGLFAGGTFTETVPAAGGTSYTNNIARWQKSNGNGWFPLQTGTASENGSSANVNALLLVQQDQTNKFVYAAGEFEKVDPMGSSPINAHYVAAWSPNENKWLPLGDTIAGFNRPVDTLAMWGDNIYAGGDFTQLSDDPTPVEYIARYDAEQGQWAAVGTENAPDGSVLAIYPFGEEGMYVGGQFLENNNLAFYNGTFWQGVGEGVTAQSGSTASINAIVTAPSLIVMGE